MRKSNLLRVAFIALVVCVLCIIVNVYEYEEIVFFENIFINNKLKFVAIKTRLKSLFLEGSTALKSNFYWPRLISIKTFVAVLYFNLTLQCLQLLRIWKCFQI